MTNDFNMDALLDSLAEKVAVRLRAGMEQRGALPPKVQPRLLSLEQAGQYLGRSRQAVEHMVRSGRLPAVKADRRVFLDRADLDEWIVENKTKSRGDLTSVQ